MIQKMLPSWHVHQEWAITLRSCRKFTVLDALFLIAAIAIGLAWTRYYQNDESKKWV